MLDTQYMIALAALLFTGYCDIFTTRLVLGLGGSELNPLARFFMQRFGTMAGLLLLKGISCIGLIYLGAQALWIGAAMTALVVMWNFRVIWSLSFPADIDEGATS